MRRAAGELEAEVLTTLWAANRPMTATEVRAEVAGGGLATTTVITSLSRLMAKGQVDRSRADGERVYRYAATRERAEHAAEQMVAFLGATGDDRRAVLARFLGRLSASDRRAAAELLRRQAR